MDPEERRTLPAAPDPLRMRFGHPTESLLHFTLLHTRPQSPLRARLLWALTAGDRAPAPAVPAPLLAALEWTPPCGAPGGCSPTSYCRTVCTRFAVLLEGAALAREVLPAGDNWVREDVVNHFYAHIDAHWLCIAAAEKLHRECDPRWGAGGGAGGRGECSAELWALALARTPPDLQFAVTRRTVPDTSALLQHSVLYNKGSISNKRILRSSFRTMNERSLAMLLWMVNLLSKLVPHRHNMRECHKIMREVCDDLEGPGAGASGALLFETVCHIVYAALLGVYRTSTVKLQLRAREVLYRQIHRGVCRSEMATLLDSCGFVVLMYVCKEYYMEMAERLPYFPVAMRDTHDWDTYCKHSSAIADMIRTRINATSSGHPLAPAAAPRPAVAEDGMGEEGGWAEDKAGTPRLWMEGIEREATAMHNKNKLAPRAAPLVYDLEWILETFFNLNLLHYPYSPTDVPPGEETRLPDPQVLVEPRRMAALRKVAACYPRERAVPVDWLILFGATIRQIADVKMAIHGMGVDLHTTLEALPRPAYALFHSFFVVCSERIGYFEVQGDLAMHVHQTSALCKAHHIVDGAPIPLVAGRLAGCRNCGDVKRPSFFPRDVKNKNADGKGNCKTTVDGAVVCSRRPQPPDWRDLHFHRYGEHAPSRRSQRSVHRTAKTLWRLNSKKIANAIMYSRCRSTPVDVIDALGKVAVWRGMPYVSCFADLRCGPLEQQKYFGDVILCEGCYNNASAEHAARLRVCAYCKGRLDTRGARVFRLWDDAAAVPRFRHVYFCTTHGPLGWVDRLSCSRLSTVIRGLTERWDTRGHDGQIVHCHVDV